MPFEKYELWETHELLGVFRETEEVKTYWLDLLYPTEFYSTDEFIDFEKIPNTSRKLAPFVAPMAQGRPIYESGSKLARFKPAYMKASDPITPSRALRRLPGSLLGPDHASPEARYDAIKADVIRQHHVAVVRRWEWLAARGGIDGKVEVDGPDYPKTLVDFERAGGHTIVLGGGARWGDSGVSILDNLQAWSDLMHAARFGGAPNRITVGTSVWSVMRKDAGVIAEMDKNRRGNDVDIKTGLIGTGEVRYVGTLGANLDVYVYNDWYEEGGVVTPFMGPKEVVLTSPAVNGVRCFGAIQDIHAQFQALAIFPRNYITTGDVAIEQIVTQSAPLMVPVNPNATLKATVLA